MIISQIVAAATPTAARSIRGWVVRLGGIGLIPLGLLDNSPIPVPGSMDLALLVLCIRGEQWWFYYSLMATAGALIGGFFTYRLASRGGKETLNRKFPQWQVDRVNKIFERWGFGAIAISAVLPPPVPITPFLIAAGATQYPARTFLTALALGRVVRYTILGYLSSLYGRKIIRWLAELGHPSALVILGAIAATAIAVFFFWRGFSGNKRATG
jgi:membrane protein YqaA with SNARE-associated domain